MATPLQLKNKQPKALASYQIIAYNLSKAKAKILQFFLKALGVKFKLEKPYPYGPQFEEKMKRGDEDIKAGRTSKLNIEKLWNEEHGISWK